MYAVALLLGTVWGVLDSEARESQKEDRLTTPAGITPAAPVQTEAATIQPPERSDRPNLRQGGDTIEEAVPVALGDTLFGTTVGYNDDYDIN